MPLRRPPCCRPLGNTQPQQLAQMPAAPLRHRRHQFLSGPPGDTCGGFRHLSPGVVVAREGGPEYPASTPASAPCRCLLPPTPTASSPLGGLAASLAAATPVSSAGTLSLRLPRLLPLPLPLPLQFLLPLLLPPSFRHVFISFSVRSSRTSPVPTRYPALTPSNAPSPPATAASSAAATASARR